MDSLLQLIKDKGLRVTSQKKEVLRSLQNNPLTVLEIFNSLNAKRVKIDKATIYRILIGFQKLGIVREINFGDRETRYELSNCEHHHHLVCESCGAVDDIKLCEDVLLEEVQKQSSFLVKDHSLEFFGICKKCQ